MAKDDDARISGDVTNYFLSYISNAEEKAARGMQEIVDEITTDTALNKELCAIFIKEYVRAYRANSPGLYFGLLRVEESIEAVGNPFANMKGSKEAMKNNVFSY